MCTLLPFLDFLYFWLTSAPVSPATVVQGVTLASWSRLVTTMLVPGPSLALPTARASAVVRLVMLAPNTTCSHVNIFSIQEIFLTAGLDLVRVTVEECRHGGAGAGHASDGLEGGGVAAAQVGRGRGHLGGHCIDNILGKNLDGNIKCIFPKMFLILPDQCTFLP